MVLRREVKERTLRGRVGTYSLEAYVLVRHRGCKAFSFWLNRVFETDTKAPTGGLGLGNIIRWFRVRERAWVRLK